jgi:hypothetical protein
VGSRATFAYLLVKVKLPISSYRQNSQVSDTDYLGMLGEVLKPASHRLSSLTAQTGIDLIEEEGSRLLKLLK